MLYTGQETDYTHTSSFLTLIPLMAAAKACPCRVHMARQAPPTLFPYKACSLRTLTRARLHSAEGQGAQPELVVRLRAELLAAACARHIINLAAAQKASGSGTDMESSPHCSHTTSAIKGLPKLKESLPYTALIFGSANQCRYRLMY